MNEIAKQLRANARRTGNRYPWMTPFSAIPLQVDEDIISRPVLHTDMDEYEMSFKVMTVFKCREFEKDRAFNNAERMLLQTIYKDMFYKITLLRVAVDGCDVEGAMNILNEMQADMGFGS